MAKNYPTYVSFGKDVLRPLASCTSEDCNWTTALGKTRTKCSHFVSAPYEMQNSLAIGETSIFKVGGAMAKASKRDVPSPTLYRIKLGTHAHFIN